MKIMKCETTLLSEGRSNLDKIYEMANEDMQELKAEICIATQTSCFAPRRSGC